MCTINVSHVYVLVCTIPGYGNYKLGTKLSGRLKIKLNKLNRCHKVALECRFISFYRHSSTTLWHLFNLLNLIFSLPLSLVPSL